MHASEAPVDWSSETVSKKLLVITALESKGLFEEEQKLKSELAQLLISTPTGNLCESFLCYVKLQEEYFSLHTGAQTKDKLNAFSLLIDSNPKRNHILAHLATLSPLFFAKWLFENSLAQMQESMLDFFRRE